MPEASGCSPVGRADQNNPIGSTPAYEPDTGACLVTSTTPRSSARKTASDSWPSADSRSVTSAPARAPRTVIDTSWSTGALSGSTTSSRRPGEFSTCPASCSCSPCSRTSRCACARLCASCDFRAS
nr:hypothetical protein [Actinosynnema pretiosum]